MSDKKGYNRLPGALTSSTTNSLLTSSARGEVNLYRKSSSSGDSISSSQSNVTVPKGKGIMVIGENANTLIEIFNFDKKKNPAITMPLFFSKSIEFLKANVENERMIPWQVFSSAFCSIQLGIIDSLSGHSRSPGANEYIFKLNEGACCGDCAEFLSHLLGTTSYFEYPATENVAVVAQLLRLFCIANPLIPARYAEKVCDLLRKLVVEIPP